MRIALCLILLAACGDDDAVEPPAIDGGPRPSCDETQAAAAPAFDDGPELPLTSITVRAARGIDGSLNGTFLNATLLSEQLPNPYAAGTSEGACRQWLENGFNCGLGSCGDDQLCVALNTCQDYPAGVSAGTLVVDGVSVEEGKVPGLYFAAGLPDGQACDEVVLQVGEVERRVRRPPALQLDEPDGGFELVAGQPLRITWTPADAGSRVRVTLRSDRGGHGELWPSIIECDAPDAAGEIVVPASMIDKHLEEFTCGECPASSFVRYRRSGDASLELVVSDEINIFIFGR